MTNVILGTVLSRVEPGFTALQTRISRSRTDFDSDFDVSCRSRFRRVLPGGENLSKTVLLSRARFVRSQVLPLENEMKRPEKFRSTCGVLNAAMTPIAILYSVVGLFGYIKYGEKTKGSITLNLPERESWVVFLGLARFSLFTFFSFSVSSEHTRLKNSISRTRLPLKTRRKTGRQSTFNKSSRFRTPPTYFRYN